MTTTAWSAPSFQVTAQPDIMDTHSDSGLDFNGDIDLELPSPAPLNDSVSLKDGETDMGFDIQAAPADQDDFMADHEDLIDEDIVTYEDADPEDGQAITTGEAAQHGPRAADEDLIDYSDEEEEPAIADEAYMSPAEEGTVDAGQTGSDSNEQLDYPAPAVAYDEPSYIREQEAVLEQQATEDLRPSEHDHSGYEGASQTGEDDQHAGLVEEKESYAKEESEHIAHKPTQDRAQSSEASHEEAVSPEVSDQARQEVQLHPVTINFAGVEYWLFQHHDYEDSGDYLIEDSTLTDKPISNVIEACRAALGEHVTDDMELGFRLDNFHNMELYQDHSSCAFITLEQFVSVYLQLHTQDGVSNPESFYMTLISRPRVSALLNILNDAAAKGIGHVGLNKDITAGLTLFNTRSADESTTYENWENAEQQEEDESQSSNEADLVEEHNEGKSVQDYEVQAEEAGDDATKSPAEQERDEDKDESVNQPQVPSVGLAEGGSDNRSPMDNQASQDVEDYASQGAKQPSPSTSAHIPEKQQDDDLIDYSEDEGDAEESYDVQTQTKGPSSASSTIQGDTASLAQESGNHEYVEVEEATHDFGGVEQEDQSQYENFDEGFADQSYEGEYYGESYAADEQDEVEAQPSPELLSKSHDDNTNYNDEFTGQPETQPVSLADVDGSHQDASQDNFGNDTFPGADTFLDFENADAFADAFANDELEDPAVNDISHHDNEDGVLGQAPVAASAAADPVVTSSSELLELSPQRQKRTIDEVGNDGGDATDSSDAKRPRV